MSVKNRIKAYKRKGRTAYWKGVSKFIKKMKSNEKKSVYDLINEIISKIKKQKV